MLIFFPGYGENMQVVRAQWSTESLKLAVSAVKSGASLAAVSRIHQS
jgi:hypothetical protein